MLNIIIDFNNKFKPDNNTIMDVEDEFLRLKLKCSDDEKKVVSLIEGGKLLDGKSYIDRFGFKMQTTNLSTGSKAALCVINNPDKIVNTDECGLNAIAGIITVCRVGTIVMRDVQIKLPYFDGHDEIDVCCMGKHFTSFEDFNEWYDNEAWR